MVPQQEQLVQEIEQLPGVRHLLDQGWTMERVEMPDGEVQVRLSAGPSAVFPGALPEVGEVNRIASRSDNLRVA